MKVFIASVIAIIAIAAVAAVVLSEFDTSTADRFQIKENVRL